MTTVNVNFKSVLIIVGLLSTLIGNVFIVGQLWKDFSIMKSDIVTIQENQNVITLKQEILELNYKIKSLRLEIDGDYRE